MRGRSPSEAEKAKNKKQADNRSGELIALVRTSASTSRAAVHAAVCSAQGRQLGTPPNSSLLRSAPTPSPSLLQPNARWISTSPACCVMIERKGSEVNISELCLQRQNSRSLEIFVRRRLLFKYPDSCFAFIHYHSLLTDQLSDVVKRLGPPQLISIIHFLLLSFVAGLHLASSVLS